MTDEDTTQATDIIRKELRRYVTYLRTSQQQGNNYSLVLSSLTRFHEYIVQTPKPSLTTRILATMQNEGCKIIGKIILDCVWEYNQRKLSAIAASVSIRCSTEPL